MKIKLNLLKLTTVVVLLASCSQKEVSIKKIPKITFSPTVVSKWYLEKEMENFFFVPLGTKKDFLIKNIDKLYFSANEIIVIDKAMKSIFIFDKKGHVLNKISHQGKGPGEYPYMVDALFDEKKQQFEVIDHSGKKILYYSFKGEFLYEKKIPDYFKLAGHLFHKSNGLYVFDKGQSSRDGMKIAVYDEEKMSYLKSLLPLPEKIRKFNYIYPHIFENYHDSIYYLPIFDDKIYAICRDTIIPVYELDYPGQTKIDQKGTEDLSNKYNFDNYMTQHGHPYCCSSLFIDGRYITFEYNYKDHQFRIKLIYSKATSKFKQFDELGSLSEPKLRILSNIKARDGDYFVMALHESINEFLPKEIKKNLKEESNPVLLFFKIKDF